MRGPYFETNYQKGPNAILEGGKKSDGKNSGSKMLLELLAIANFKAILKSSNVVLKLF